MGKRVGARTSRRAEALPHGRAACRSGCMSAAVEEGGQEIEEVLGVHGAVVVEISEGGRGEESGEEVEEVLGVADAVGVEVGAAEAEADVGRRVLQGQAGGAGGKVHVRELLLT